MGYDFDQLYPNRFLKAGEFRGQDVTLTIKAVTLDELEGSKGPEMKAVLAFEKTPKLLVLNKTNGLCLKGMFGRQTDDWIGKRVTFYPAAIQFEDNDLAIRVRGSPDLAADVQVEIKLARKKPRTVTMKKTGPPAAKANGKAAAPKPAEEEPEDMKARLERLAGPLPPPKKAKPGPVVDVPEGMSEEEAEEIVARERAAAEENPFP